MAAAGFTSYNSAFNETTVISHTDIIIDLILTGKGEDANFPLPTHLPIARHLSETSHTHTSST